MKNKNQAVSRKRANVRCLPDDVHTVLIGALEQLITQMVHLRDADVAPTSHSRNWLSQQQAVAEVLAGIARSNDTEIFLRDWILNAYKQIKALAPQE